MSLHTPQSFRPSAATGSLDRRVAAERRRKVTVPWLASRKAAGERIAALTAYDYPSALVADGAGIDVILVGDSLANTALGYENTILVSQEEMLVALKAVRRAVQRALLVMDMVV